MYSYSWFYSCETIRRFHSMPITWSFPIVDSSQKKPSECFERCASRSTFICKKPDFMLSIEFNGRSKIRKVTLTLNLRRKTK